MTTTAPSPSVRAHEVPVPVMARTHRREVVRWALATGRPLHRDALAAIVGARSEALPDDREVEPSTVDPGASSTWRATDLGGLLWVEVADWCAVNGAELPEADAVTTTLSTYLRFLSGHRLLARGSDPVAALRRALADYGGTTRSSSHPSMRHQLAPVVPLG